MENIEDLDVDTSAGAGSNFGTGGMATKIAAARLATASGCHTRVMHSNRIEELTSVVVEGAVYGTLFLAVSQPLIGRKRWILLQKPAAGRIIVNGKAEVALNNDKSLVGTHITSVEGEFESAESVPLFTIDEENDGELKEFGRAICNYSVEARSSSARKPTTSSTSSGTAARNPWRTKITSACGSPGGRRQPVRPPGDQHGDAPQRHGPLGAHDHDG